MEGSNNKYILLVDCVGNTLLRDLQAEPGLSTKATPTQVLRGELLEALPKAEQPSDFPRIALVGIERKSLRLECPTANLTRLLDEEVNLLLGISSTESRYQTFIDKQRLDFGQRLSLGDLVFVSVKGSGQHLPGVVRYKGALPPWRGAVFGVELTEHPGHGASDGTYIYRRYFTCPPESGVFVGLDRLTPREDPDSKSPKRDKNAQGGESLRQVRRTNLVNSVDAIRVAGESSQTDPTAFIEQQRQIFNEIRLFREKGQQEDYSQRPLSEMEQQVKRIEEQLREKDRELENFERLLSEREQHLTHFVQRQLREKELQEASLHEQLPKKTKKQNSQKQFKGNTTTAERKRQSRR